MSIVSARELASRLRNREVSAVEVVREHLAIIERRNPELNAIVTLTAENALAKAREADAAAARGEFLGPLHGVPVAHKDLQETKGVRTTYGSPLFADYVPDFDTETVRRIGAAGAISLGKTNTPEFGAGSQTFNPVFGKTRNPYDTSLTCGGSSGGAAVALATGMVALADGSDTGGSLRNPASFCSVFGLRPTPGLVPVAFESPLTVDGPMARSAADASLLFEAIADLPGHSELDRDFRGTRIAWCGEMADVPFDPRVLAAVEVARPRLQRLGCVVEEAQPDFSGADAAFRVLRAREFHARHASKQPRNRIKETVVKEIERGERLTAEEIQSALEARRVLMERMRQFFDSYDFFVLPTVQVLPFDIDQPYVTEINGQPMQGYIDWMKSCYYVTMLGGPAASVPCGFSPEGLPAGLQIAAAPGRDWDVLQLAHGFELTA
ncbi:MAG: amidase [Acidobacteria bacterium]|nr:amidase [Acidobacteriota bacterium]